MDMNPKKDEGREDRGCLRLPCLRPDTLLAEEEEETMPLVDGRVSQSAQMLPRLSTALAGVLLVSRHFMNATCRWVRRGETGNCKYFVLLPIIITHDGWRRVHKDGTYGARVDITDLRIYNCTRDRSEARQNRDKIFAWVVEKIFPLS